MKLHLWIGQRATRSVPSVTAALLSPCPALRRVLSRSRPCPPSDSDNRDASRAGPVHHSDSDAPTRGCGWAPSPFPRWARALPSVRRRQPTGGGKPRAPWTGPGRAGPGADYAPDAPCSPPNQTFPRACRLTLPHTTLVPSACGWERRWHRPSRPVRPASPRPRPVDSGGPGAAAARALSANQRRAPPDPARRPRAPPPGAAAAVYKRRKGRAAIRCAGRPPGPQSPTTAIVTCPPAP